MKNKILLCAVVALISIYNFSFLTYTKEIAEVISIEEAVKIGLENSITLQKVNNKTLISKLVEENAKDKKQVISDSSQQLLYAQASLNTGTDKVFSSINQLDAAETALKNGIAPVDIPVKNPADGTLVLTINIGQDILSSLTSVGLESFYNQVIQGVQTTIDEQRVALNNGMATLDYSTREFNKQKSKYDASITLLMANIANKLGLSVISNLQPDPVGVLLSTMAEKSNATTAYSFGIYKNQIALLIQNNYYEGLKFQKLLDVKSKTVERAKTQYEFAKYSYEAGAKAKDDMLMAKSYYSSTLIDYNMGLKNYNNALIELKKSMNIPMDKNITLQEVALSKSEKFDLKQGIVNGLMARLEIKTAIAQKDIYNALMTAVRDSDYNDDDNEYKEADLLLKGSEIEKKNSEIEVESSIRQSYETLSALKQSLKDTDDLLVNSKEALEIAKYKYDAGFGSDTALLQNVNLQQMSGTIMEVIVADENMASVEEKVIELTNGYNIAKAKYLNDIGVLTY